MDKEWTSEGGWASLNINSGLSGSAVVLLMVTTLIRSLVSSKHTYSLEGVCLRLLEVQYASVLNSDPGA